MKSTTQKFIEHLTPVIKKIIVFDALTFIESAKYNHIGNDIPKSLYLKFGAWNSNINRMQLVTYEIGTGHIDITLHSLRAKIH